MDRLLHCSCGQANTVSDVAAGQSIPCTECGEALSVPSFRELRLLPAVESTSGVPKSETDFSLPKICFLGGLLIMALGSAMALSFDPAMGGIALTGLILCVFGWLKRPKS